MLEVAFLRQLKNGTQSMVRINSVDGVRGFGGHGAGLANSALALSRSYHHTFPELDVLFKNTIDQLR
jgi:hypothetical protein